jgi:hypothetical protein
MADHGTVEYATAAGNDYPSHEKTYEKFVHLTFAGSIFVIVVLLGLTVGGVLGDWLPAFVMIFAIAPIGLAAGMASGSKTPAYVSFVLSFLIFAFTAL